MLDHFLRKLQTIGSVECTPESGRLWSFETAGNVAALIPM